MKSSFSQSPLSSGRPDNDSGQLTLLPLKDIHQYLGHFYRSWKVTNFLQSFLAPKRATPRPRPIHSGKRGQVLFLEICECCGQTAAKFLPRRHKAWFRAPESGVGTDRPEIGKDEYIELEHQLPQYIELDKQQPQIYWVGSAAATTLICLEPS